MMDDDRLRGEVTAKQVLGWTDQEWRLFQFGQMVSTNRRLSRLESQANWRNVLTTIPWAIVGALIVLIVK